MAPSTKKAACAGMPSVTYGFIGLGNMGSGMALNLRANMPASSQLIVCEIDNERLENFSRLARQVGTVETVSTPREVVERSEIIITSLPPGKAIDSVFNDKSSGVFAAASTSSKLIIETSSVPVEISLQFSKEVERLQMGTFLDCPVSGGIPPAQNGTLTCMAGGPKEVFDRARPVLASMATPEHIYYCGPAGAGLATKIINNYVATISLVGLCEGMNTGVRYGLDPKVLSDVINASSGMSWNSKHMNPVKGVQPTSSASRDFEGGASFELAVESTEMATDLMNQVNAKWLFADVLKDLWARAIQNPLCAGKEYRSIYRLFAEEEGRGLGRVSIE